MSQLMLLMTPDRLKSFYQLSAAFVFVLILTLKRVRLAIGLSLKTFDRGVPCAPGGYAAVIRRLREPPQLCWWMTTVKCIGGTNKNTLTTRYCRSGT